MQIDRHSAATELEPRKFAAFERELDGLSGQTTEHQ
jgi:hypothetical protein